MIRWQQRVAPGAASTARSSGPDAAEQPQPFGVSWWVTGRSGGHSAAPFDGANLAHHVGDDPVAVGRNRDALAAAVGVQPAQLRFMSQVHGARVAVLEPETARHPPAGDAGTGPSPEADAMVTIDPSVALVVLVADCTPILLADRRRGAVGVVHAGRPGVEAGVVDAALAAMTDVGCDPGDIEAVIGPSVCSRCYEVPAEMRDTFAARHPAGAAVSWTGTPAVDVAGAAVDRLHHSGVQRVTWLPGCTREDDDLYSYRRDGRTGRFAAVVRLIADPPTSGASG